MDWVNIEKIDAALYTHEHNQVPRHTHRVSAGSRDEWPNGEVHFSGDFSYGFRVAEDGNLHGFINYPQQAQANFHGSVEALTRLLKRSTKRMVLQDRRWDFWN